jgi:hypothetical protein
MTFLLTPQRLRQPMRAQTKSYLGGSLSGTRISGSKKPRARFQRQHLRGRPAAANTAR